ncbi:DUF6379 domain-containing protein [Klebsiella pneumoniae]|uniref:C-glycoside deglycosidase beta subunit domain-containing protein n=1 Tax=Klebsiella pneumoniae TaxID=573 RepID=UPI001ABD36BD|nr:DUF6379 domain-containing protein [Klebsiella pneumoniae]MBO3721278.1 hypothetical protein [Klebsiella pneumoniae]HCM5830600.1 hypothetical protein [Klebsiella pneumoniae]
MFAAFNELLIRPNGLKLTKVNDCVTGFEFELGLPSYRGIYLSCIEDISLKVDGVKVDESQVRLEINNKVFTLQELSSLFAEYWYVMDRATLRVRDSSGLALGSHLIEMSMKERIPYAGYNGGYLVIDKKDIKELNLNNESEC